MPRATWTRPTRLWPFNKWVQLVKLLDSKGYEVLLLGGELEHEKNIRLSQDSAAYYPGYFPLKEFFQLIQKTDLVVTSVSMAFHAAIALEKKVVLLNNIFNRNEFDFFGLGEIIEPELECVGCFQSACEKKCMELISVASVQAACERLVGIH